MIGWILFFVGAVVCLLNCYLSWLRYPIHLARGGSPQTFKWSSGVPLVGSLTVVIAWAVWLRHLSSLPLDLAVLALAVLDMGGVHWFLIGLLLPPAAREPAGPTPVVEYAGFWIRVLASVIDSIVIGVVVFPLLILVYGKAYFETTSLLAGPADLLISWILPAVAVVILWITKESTPGKMALDLRIVDAATGGHATARQYIVRYLGYYVSIFPLGLGLFWVGWDARKQGWHDKIAGTIVVRRRS